MLSLQPHFWNKWWCRNALDVPCNGCQPSQGWCKDRRNYGVTSKCIPLSAHKQTELSCLVVSRVRRTVCYLLNCGNVSEMNDCRLGRCACFCIFFALRKTWPVYSRWQSCLEISVGYHPIPKEIIPWRGLIEQTTPVTGNIKGAIKTPLEQIFTGSTCGKSSTRIRQTSDEVHLSDSSGGLQVVIADGTSDRLPLTALLGLHVIAMRNSILTQRGELR